MLKHLHKNNDPKLIHSHIQVLRVQSINQIHLSLRISEKFKGIKIKKATIHLTNLDAYN